MHLCLWGTTLFRKSPPPHFILLATRMLRLGAVFWPRLQSEILAFFASVASTFGSLPVAGFSPWEFLWVQSSFFSSSCCSCISCSWGSGQGKQGWGMEARSSLLGRLRGGCSRRCWLREGFLERPRGDGYTAALVDVELLNSSLQQGYSGKVLCMFYHD